MFHLMSNSHMLGPCLLYLALSCVGAKCTELLKKEILANDEEKNNASELINRLIIVALQKSVNNLPRT